MKNNSKRGRGRSCSPKGKEESSSTEPGDYLHVRDYKGPNAAEYKSLQYNYSMSPHRNWSKYSFQLPYNVPNAKCDPDIRVLPARRNESKRNHPSLHQARNIAETVMMAEIRSRNIFTLVEVAPGSSHRRRREQLINWGRQYESDPSYGAPPKYLYMQPALSSYDRKFLEGPRKFRDINDGLVEMHRFSTGTVAQTEEMPKGAYYLGNVCYYLNVAEWHKISQAAVMGIYVYCLYTTKESGYEEGVEWESKDGNFIFRFDDRSMWCHRLDWFDRLKTTKPITRVWEELCANGSLRHELWYIAPHTIVDFDSYPEHPIGYLETPKDVNPDDARFIFMEKEQQGPILPPPALSPPKPPRVEQSLRLSERRRAWFEEATKLMAACPPSPATDPTPAANEQRAAWSEAAQLLLETTPSPPKPPRTSEPPPPPATTDNAKPGLWAALVNVWAALCVLCTCSLDYIPFMEWLINAKDGLSRKCTTEWRPYLDISHYIHPKAGKTDSELAEEFPDPDELVIANKLINISLVENDNKVRASHIQTMARSMEGSAANLVDIAVRCEPHIKRARTRLSGEDYTLFQKACFAVALGTILNAWWVYQLSGGILWYFFEVFFAAKELITCIPKPILGSIFGLGVSQLINRRRFVMAILMSCCAVWLFTPSLAFWATRSPLPHDPPHFDSVDNMLGAALETVFIAICGWPAMLICIVGDMVTWHGVGFSAILVHVATWGFTQKGGIVPVVLSVYLHIMHNLGIVNNAPKFVLAMGWCFCMGNLGVRNYKVMALCFMLLFLSYAQMSIFYQHMEPATTEDIYTLLGDVIDGYLSHLQIGREMRFAFYKAAGPSRFFEMFRELVKLAGEEEMTIPLKACQAIRNAFTAIELEELFPQLVSVCGEAGWSNKALFITSPINAFGLTVWMYTRSWGYAVSPLYDLLKPSATRGLEVAPICMGPTTMQVRAGAKGTPPNGKCSQNTMGYHLMGPRISFVTIGSHKGCSCNTWRAMVHRMAGTPKRYKDNPATVTNNSDEVSTQFNKVWREIFPYLQRGVSQQPDVRLKPVKLLPWEWEKRYTIPQAAKLRVAYLIGNSSTHYSIFVKKEKLMFTSLRAEDLDPANWGQNPEGFTAVHASDSRGISVPPPAVRYENGPDADFYNKTIMHRFNGQVFYACGSTPEILGRWADWLRENHDWGLAVMGDDVVLIYKEGDAWMSTSLDISRYDQHIRRCHLEASFQYMRSMGLGKLAANLRALSKPRRYIIKNPIEDGRLKVDATRASGDPDTISSNSIITIAIAWWGQINGIPLKDAFYMCGFETTGMSEPYHSGKWDFLQKIFYPANTNWGGSCHPAPKLGRFAARAFWSSNPYSPANRPAYCRGVALSLQKDFNHVPVARAIIQRILILTAHTHAVYDRDYLRAMEFGLFSKEMSQVHPLVYNLFEDRYGVGKDECDQVEDRISRLGWDEFIDDAATREFWERVIRVDL